MPDIVNAPDMEFDADHIIWDNTACPRYAKRSLIECANMSSILLPLSATLMCLGFFFCCYLWKPQKPYALSCGVVMRYPFAITLLVYSWSLYNFYSYFAANECILG